MIGIEHLESRTMKTMTKMSIALVSALSLGVAHAEFEPTKKTEKVEKKVAKKVEEKSSNSISSSVTNGKGSVIYGKKVVWEGKVKKGLSQIAKSENGKNSAAAYDGRKVVWELNEGDGKLLRPKKKKDGKKKKDPKK